MGFKKFSSKIWLWAIVLICALSTVFYLILVRGAKFSYTEQSLNTEQVITKAQATNISSFFSLFSDSLIVLQRTIEGKSDKQISKLMDDFVLTWAEDGLIGGVALTDKYGVVVLNSNSLGTPDIGDSLADRDFFDWAVNQKQGGAYYVGNHVTSRLGASKNKVIIPVAVPVFEGNEFRGVLVASVILESLTEHYLGLLRLSKFTEVYLLNESGVILFGPTKEIIEENIDILDPDFISGKSALSDIATATKSNSPGSFEVNYLSPVSNRRESRVLTYQPINLKVKKMLVVVSSPLSEIAQPLKQAYLRQLLTLIFSTIVLLAFGLVIAKELSNQKTLSK